MSQSSIRVCRVDPTNRVKVLGLAAVALLAACNPTTPAPPVVLLNVVVTPAAPSVALGTTQQFAAVGTYSNGTVTDITSSVEWSSSDEAVAAVDAVGLTDALGTGTATVTATLGSSAGHAILTVTDAVLVSIAVTPEAPSIAKGTTQQFAAEGTFSDATTQDLTTLVTWATSDLAAASVDAEGLATGENAGTATISATLGEVSGTAALTVTDALLVSIAVTPAAPRITAVGLTQQFVAEGTFSDASKQDITHSVVWSIAPTGFATISNAAGSEGLATGVAAGVAVVTATSADAAVEGTADLTVTTDFYVVNVAIGGFALGDQLVLVNNGGDDLTAAAGDTALAFSTTIAEGLGYNVTVKRHPKIPDQVCTPTNNVGLVPNHAVTVTVTCASYAPRFAYAANHDDDTLSMYTVDAVHGGLHHNGYVRTGALPMSATVDPTGRFVYVCNQTDATISTYAVNAVNGSLTEVGSPVSSRGTAPISLAIATTAEGTFAYVANNGSNTVAAFSLDAFGVLTSIAAGPTIGTGANPYFVTADPSGSWVYVANFTDGSVSAYGIQQDGTLVAKGSALLVGQAPTSVVVSPSGKVAYVTLFTDWAVKVYDLHGAAGLGALTYVTQLSSMREPRHIAFDPTGRLAFVAHVDTSALGAIDSATVDATSGALTQVSVDVRTGGVQNMGVTVDPSGKFVYVPNAVQDNIAVFAITAGTGAVQRVAMIAARMGVYGVGMTRGVAPVTYAPKYAYVANDTTANVSTYRVDVATGALTEVGTAVAAGTNPSAVAVDPLGRFAYVTNFTDDTISTYGISATTGALTEVGTAVATGLGPKSVAVDSTGRFVYVANNGGDTVSSYSIEPATGALAEIGSPLATGAQPHSVTVSPSGKVVFVTATGTGVSVISIFTIDPASGALTVHPSGAVPAGISPAGVTVHPSGSFAYVANLGGGIARYSITPRSGWLTSLGTETTAGGSPIAIAFDPTGRFAYVANNASSPNGSLSVYTVDALTGLLTANASGATIATGPYPTSVTVDPSGKFVYVTNHGTGGDVWVYAIAADGTLSKTGTATAGGKPIAIAVSGSIQ